MSRGRWEQMRERYLRALSFAIFATIGLIVGGFVIGYGAALLSLPSPAPVLLPTLAPTPASALDSTTPTSGTISTAPPGPNLELTAPAALAIPSHSSNPNERAAEDGLRLALENLDVNSALGGIEVAILLHNGTERGMSFSFKPETDLDLVDSLGHHYILRWAEYEGEVKVPAGGSIRLVRAFFDGVPSEDVQSLTVGVKHPPQLPEFSWTVDLRE